MNYQSSYWHTLDDETDIHTIYYYAAMIGLIPVTQGLFFLPKTFKSLYQVQHSNLKNPPTDPLIRAYIYTLKNLI